MFRFAVLIALTIFTVGAEAQKTARIDRAWERYVDSLIAANPYAQIPLDTLLNRVYEQQLPYQTIAARARLVWDNQETKQDFQGSIRMKKDSVIWGSLYGAMGVEGVRLLLTPDTLMIINKLNNQYATRSFKFLRDWLLFPVTFRMIQQTLAGQKVEIGEIATAAFWQDSMYVIYYETDQLQEKIWVEPRAYTITKMLLKDKLLQQDMLITFDGYSELNGKPFSYKRTVEINRGTQKVHLGLEVTRITVDGPVDFPFEITDRYKKSE
ncbi:MAG: DUF4292 domain-containing protein [Chitinophagales bacterium]|nr:DUF4292 domain-containing protein [Chitinophagales bacterium]MDW8420062.1 DUF4292 domain-containing protein [Chitinophagales bacterium]